MFLPRSSILDYANTELPGACYNLQYLDKTLVNYANVMGLKDDTNSAYGPLPRRSVFSRNTSSTAISTLCL